VKVKDSKKKKEEEKREEIIIIYLGFYLCYSLVLPSQYSATFTNSVRTAHTT